MIRVANFDRNQDPGVANQLRHLYEHPDYVEMYPGIVAEEAKKPMIPGVGIAPTFTISRAILSDAVTLVRSDRFYTVGGFPHCKYPRWELVDKIIDRLSSEKPYKLGLF